MRAVTSFLSRRDYLHSYREKLKQFIITQSLFQIRQEKLSLKNWLITVWQTSLRKNAVVKSYFELFFCRTVNSVIATNIWWKKIKFWSSNSYSLPRIKKNFSYQITQFTENVMVSGKRFEIRPWKKNTTCLSELWIILLGIKKFWCYPKIFTWTALIYYLHDWFTSIIQEDIRCSLCRWHELTTCWARLTARDGAIWFKHLSLYLHKTG